MPIKFRCPDCKAKIKVSEQFAGQLGVCPTCRKRTTIPQASDPEFAAEFPGKPPSAVGPGEGAERKASAVQMATDEPESSKPPAAEEPEATAKTESTEGKSAEPKAAETKSTETEGGDAKGAEAKSAPAFIRFKCPNCEKPTGFPSHLAGKPATCPLCKIQVMVPEESGGESFVVGVAPPGSKPRTAMARAPSHVTPALAGMAAAPAPVVAPLQSSKPPWVLLVAVGGVLLIAAVLIGVVIGGMGKNTPPEQQATAGTNNSSPPTRPTTTAPVRSTRPAATRTPANTAQVVQDPATPYAPAVTVPAEPDPAEIAPDKTKPNAQEPATPADPNPTGEKAEPAADPKNLIPVTLPQPPAKKDDEEETTKTAQTGNEAVQDLLQGKPKTKATETPTEPQTIDPVPKPLTCVKCQGVGYLPIPNIRPYVYTYGEKPMDPSAMVPWVYCDQCMKDKDNKELLALEAERFAKSMAKCREWDTMLGPIKSKLVHVETRHVLLHCELSPVLAKQVGTTLDKLASMLQTRSHSVMLTQARPDTHELVILGSTGSYNALITVLEKASPGDEWAMFRKTMGFSLGKTAIFNAGDSGQSGPEPMAIHQLSKMFMSAACGGKAPAWLGQGFSSHCENQLTRRNLCYTFAYELNEVKFGENWNQDIRKFALQGQLKKWDYIFPMDLIGLKSLDYLTCYSMVGFFMGDAGRFVKMVGEIRDGTPSAQAVEKAYARPVKELQTMWANWAVQQR